MVGVLQPGVPDLTFVTVAALRQGSRDLGYIEGQSIRLEYRWAEGKVDILPSLAAELVRLNVDVLYASGPQAMRAAWAHHARFPSSETISKTTPSKPVSRRASANRAATLRAYFSTCPI
jgi:putative ABC transport system substrate-binding protein